MLLAALAGALGTARLGLWQLDRAAQKTVLHDALLARGAMPALDAAALARREERMQESRRSSGPVIFTFTAPKGSRCTRPFSGSVRFPLACVDTLCYGRTRLQDMCRAIPAQNDELK